MSSLSRPARSGPNSTPARRSRAPISRSSAAAPRAVSTGLMMWRGRGQVANTRCRSATASATEANTVAASRMRSAPDELRHAFSCGQPSRGATRRRWNSPPFAMARAQAPMLSASCGRTRMTTGELPIGASSAPPSRPVISRASPARIHEGDLLLLRGDDVLRQFTQLRILAVLQFDLRHVDRALVVRDHAGDEVLVGIARVGDRHALVHLRHRIAIALGGRRLVGRRRSHLHALHRLCKRR